VERIDGLEQDHRDLMAGFRAHYADRNPKALEAEQRRYFAKLERGEQRQSHAGMSLDLLRQFPGFDRYRKPPVS
jgi:hypothetical protein